MLFKPGQFIRYNLEAIIWIAALISLAFMSPDNSGTSLCMFHRIGIDSCPGCGLGHSISSALHGDFKQSFQMHPLGILAIVILLFRILSVFRDQYKYQKLNTEAYDKDL